MALLRRGSLSKDGKRRCRDLTRLDALLRTKPGSRLSHPRLRRSGQAHSPTQAMAKAVGGKGGCGRRTLPSPSVRDWKIERKIKMSEVLERENELKLDTAGKPVLGASPTKREMIGDAMRTDP